MVRKLASYGEPLAEVGGQLLTMFPTVEQIASLSEEELRAAGFGYRGRSIPIVARQILEKPEGWLEGLRHAPYEEVHRELTGLYSVGPKLADCVALYGLNKLEAAPIDTHLWQAIGRLYKPDWQGRALTDARYREGATLMRERFGELAGLAHLFLYFDNQQTWRNKPPGSKT
jgi:3-methyladenine DNA glycosylase/8-oxoguanine DNA glycosylase